jgi:hypothetical protein
LQTERAAKRGVLRHIDDVTYHLLAVGAASTTAGNGQQGGR